MAPRDPRARASRRRDFQILGTVTETLVRKASLPFVCAAPLSSGNFRASTRWTKRAGRAAHLRRVFARHATQDPTRGRARERHPGFFQRHDNVYAYVPNLIGYARVILAGVALAHAFTDVRLSLAAYLLSFVCDELDGRFARKFDQCSELGKVLDMVRSRAGSLPVGRRPPENPPSRLALTPPRPPARRPPRPPRRR